MLRGDLQNGIAGPAAAASALPSASTHRRCTSQVPLILPLPGAGDIRRYARQSAQPPWRWMTHRKNNLWRPNRTWGLSSFLAGFLAVGPQTVTCPPNRVDDGLTELAAQVPHVHVDEVRPGIEVHAPGQGQ